MNQWMLAPRWLALAGLLQLALLPSAWAEDWLPVTQDELAMTRDPKAPGAPAVYLYREVNRDDQGSTEEFYARIKVLTDEGRDRANVRLIYGTADDSIWGIKARTIRPDGRIVVFDGKVFEHPVVAGQRARQMEKTFTLPDVQVGSIIEYRYHRNLSPTILYDSHWILSDDLFTHSARFSLVPYPYPLTYSWPRGLPPGATKPELAHGKIHLTAQDIPAFVTEDYMPPPNEMKYRVDFNYGFQQYSIKDEKTFWTAYSKDAWKEFSRRTDKERAMKKAVEMIVQPSDSPEEKLRKIYARTQQLHNLTYERARSEQEIARDKDKDSRTVEDVWSLGRGSDMEINWLFIALARAAGIEVAPVLTPTRDAYFFEPKLLNARQLDSTFAVAKIDGKDVFLAPGEAFVPFGALPWNETLVPALRLDKAGGTWFTTPPSETEFSRIDHKATLTLDSGTLTGKVTVTYTGYEAIWRRVEERLEDDTDRREFLEDQIKRSVPTGIHATLTNSPDWSSSDKPLVAEYDISIPGWAASVGRRQLLAIGLFGNQQDHILTSAARVQPIYFDYPYTQSDDVTIHLPAALHVASVPKANNNDRKALVFSSSVSVDNNGSSLHLKRDLMSGVTLLNVKYYPVLHDFYQSVRSADEEQIVLSPEAAPSQH